MSSTERINYFSGFEHKPAHYEDNLTRAFLVLLRLVPPVQAVFIDALRDVQLSRGGSEILPSRTESGAVLRGVWTQTTRLHADEGRVVSVLLSGSEWHPEASVEASDRGAVYDGVLHYGERWVLVLENKPYGNVWEEQLSPNLQGASGLDVEPQALVVVWEDLIARLHGLLEGEWLGLTQSLLVYDFLQYVQSEFKWLNPYPSLASCGDDLALLNHRCVAIMKELAPGRLEYHQGGDPFIDAEELRAVKRVLLSVEEADQGWDLLLRVYPGDTVAQARAVLHAGRYCSARETSRAMGREREPPLLTHQQTPPLVPATTARRWLRQLLAGAPRVDPQRQGGGFCYAHRGAL